MKKQQPTVRDLARLAHRAGLEIELKTEPILDAFIRKADEELIHTISLWKTRLRAGQSCEPVWAALAVTAWLREQREKQKAKTR